MIQEIEIKNVKGIGSGNDKLKISFEIIPNKPSLFIAPNGFGKSSLAVAFQSLNRERLKLDDNHFHKELDTNEPELKIKLKKGDDIFDLIANKDTNTIKNQLDSFVINSKVKAKGLGKYYGSTLHIDPIVLIDSTPNNEDLNYSYTQAKANFGINGKILPNIDRIKSNKLFFSNLLSDDKVTMLLRGNNITVQKKIAEIKDYVNNLSSTKTINNVINDLKANKIADFQSIEYLHPLASYIMSCNFAFEYNNEIEAYLIAIQLIDLFNNSNLKLFCERKEYELLKSGFDELFEDFNSTWVEFETSIENGALVLKFPRPYLISNGQRDVLSFIAQLKRAEIKLKKDYCILIIDEVFDYLDDANLIAVQYYVTNFIDKFKEDGRFIYPIVLTHLDPLYFRGYVFGRKHKIKSYYLNKGNASVDPHLINLLKERNNPASPVKGEIEKYLLHFHTEQINKRSEFEALGLKPTWGENSHFNDYIEAEKEKYCNTEENFDPFAVCSALRIKIEKIVYDKILQETQRNVYLNEKDSGTNDKLEYAISINIPVKDTYFYLGILYNPTLHWRDQTDNISPIMAKLDNLVLKKMIIKVFEE
jgi:hypothetical protein